MTEITAYDRQRLRYQLKQVVKVDPGLQRILDAVGYPLPRKQPAEFSTMLQIITSQQLSTESAAAINQRLRRCCAGQPTWRKILRRKDQVLRDCGLSRQKIAYAKDLARMFQKGLIDLDAMRSMDTEKVVDTLIQVRGFGRWSCEIFSMFALGHRDVYPAGDLALRIAVQRYAGRRARLTEKQVEKYATRWSPYRSAVALLMWKYYGATTLAE